MKVRLGSLILQLTLENINTYSLYFFQALFFGGGVFIREGELIREGGTYLFFGMFMTCTKCHVILPKTKTN